jgi:hypothetical protein
MFYVPEEYYDDFLTPERFILMGLVAARNAVDNKIQEKYSEIGEYIWNNYPTEVFQNAVRSNPDMRRAMGYTTTGNFALRDKVVAMDLIPAIKCVRQELHLSLTEAADFVKSAKYSAIPKDVRDYWANIAKAERNE